MAASRVGVRDVGDSDDDVSVREGGDGVGADGRRGIELKKCQSHVGGRKKSDRCCVCCVTGSCVRCSCVLRSVPCTSCVPSRSGKCMNQTERVSEVVRSKILRSDDGGAHVVSGASVMGQLAGNTWLERAFGAQLVQGSS